jgi:hypothetical protein
VRSLHCRIEAGPSRPSFIVTQRDAGLLAPTEN